MREMRVEDDSDSDVFGILFDHLRLLPMDGNFDRGGNVIAGTMWSMDHRRLKRDSLEEEAKMKRGSKSGEDHRGDPQSDDVDRYVACSLNTQIAG